MVKDKIKACFSYQFFYHLSYVLSFFMVMVYWYVKCEWFSCVYSERKRLFLVVFVKKLTMSFPLIT